MDANTVSKDLGDALLQSQDNLQSILENMVLLGEPHTEYERLMVMLAYLDALADDLREQAALFKEGNINVVFGHFDAGTNKKNR